MPKQLSTYAKCSSGVRNPFTRRCITLQSDQTKHLIKLAHHPKHFKAELKAVGFHKPEIKTIQHQWEYIARLRADPPATLPVPAPDQLPPKMAAKLVEHHPKSRYAKGKKEEKSKSGSKKSHKKISITGEPLVELIPLEPSDKPAKVIEKKPLPKSASKTKGPSLAKVPSKPLQKKMSAPKLPKSLSATKLPSKTSHKKLKSETEIKKEKKGPSHLEVCRAKLLRTEKELQKCRGSSEARRIALQHMQLNLPEQSQPLKRLKKRSAPESAPAPQPLPSAEKLKKLRDLLIPKEISTEEPLHKKHKKGEAQPKGEKVEEINEEVVLKNMIKRYKQQHEGRLGLGALPYKMRELTAERIKSILYFMVDPANYKMVYKIPQVVKYHPLFENLVIMYPALREEYNEIAKYVLAAPAKMEQMLREKNIKSAPRELINTAAEYLAKEAIFSLLSHKDFMAAETPEVQAMMNPEGGIIAALERDLQTAYANPATFDLQNLKEPLTFMLGAGASADAGIETFVGMSKQTGEALDEMLRAAWARCPKYTDKEIRQQAKSVQTADTIEKYFFVKNPGTRIRHCLTSMAREFYAPMLLAAWEFMYRGIAGKKAGYVQNLIAALQPVGAPANKFLMANVVTMNIDGLEYAAGIDPLSVVPAHGNVLFKQKYNDEIGTVIPTPVTSIDEIRSGEFRPAVVLYGENVIPTSAKYQDVIDLVAGGTLIIIGASFTTGGGLLKLFEPETVLIVDPDVKTVNKVITLLDSSTEKTETLAKDPNFEGYTEDYEDDEGDIPGFRMGDAYGLRNALELKQLLDRAYSGINVIPSDQSNIEPEVLQDISESISVWIEP